MLVYVKSVPDVVDNVVHVIASLPVTVNVIVADVEVAADAANVTVGAVVSIIISLAPAILLAPVGTVVDVITLPALSIGALVNAYDDTVRSELV
jgi:hypothetical protein